MRKPENTLNTTTSNIQFSSEGILVNQVFTRSAFKKAYIIEQASKMDFLCNGEEKPLLLDLTKIKPSYEEIRKMLSYNNFYTAKSVAVLVKSKTMSKMLRLWYKIFVPSVPTNAFFNKKKANKWLESYA